MDSTNMDKKWLEIKEELLQLNDLQQDYNAKYNTDYVESYLNWIKETVTKNKFIYRNKYDKSKTDFEILSKNRTNVYWIDFGINIGSEFQGYHFALVLYENTYTAIVVPLSSEKDEFQSWKENDESIIPIGEINGFEEKKPCYALINQIQAVSKKRLDRIGIRPNFKKIKLSPEQMDLIDKAIINMLTKPIKE